MFRRLGAAAARRPLLIVLVWLLLAASWFAIAVVGVTGQGLFDRLHSGEPVVPGSESQVGREIVGDASTTGESLTLALTDIDLTDPEALAQVQRTLNAFRPNVQGVEGVQSVMDPFQVPGGLEDPSAAALLSTEGDGFVVSVTLEPDLSTSVEDDAREEIVSLMRDVPADLGGDVSGLVSGSHLITEEIVGQLERDLQRGELVALPLSLLIMVVVFGGFLAAGIPIFGALASIAGGLGALYGFSFWLELDSAVVNVVTVMALGLSIDYGLLIVSRYREELRRALAEAGTAPSRRSRGRVKRGKDPVVRAALVRTMSTAGRTVAFSGLTVAICVAGLMVMRADILKAVGAAGLSVVLIAVITAMSLVPALLALFGRRLTKPGLLSRVPGVRALVARLGDVAPEQGFFSRLATVTQKRPWIVVILSTALLVLMASPLLNVHLRNSTFELVPEGSEQRTFLHLIDDSYPALATPPVSVVVETSSAVEIAEQISGIENVTGIDPPQDIDETYSMLAVRLDTDDAGGTVATEAVGAIRDLRDDADLSEFWVTGQAAAQVDFVESMAEGAPYAAGLVVLAIFVLLFLMTGSLLIPLKALIVNTLSLAAGMGVTAWIFAEGHLEGLLGFTSTGGLESYVVAMAAAFGFGLAMDYEVFLLARIKEHWDAGETNDVAVRNGLQRTGRIITSAGLVMIVVFGGFMTGEMLIIKQVGFALAFTVLLDATLVRILLVPATMTMLGRANWWAPGPLRRLHARFGIHHCPWRTGAGTNRTLDAPASVCTARSAHRACDSFRDRGSGAAGVGRVRDREAEAFVESDRAGVLRVDPEAHLPGRCQALPGHGRCQGGADAAPAPALVGGDRTEVDLVHPVTGARHAPQLALGVVPPEPSVARTIKAGVGVRQRAPLQGGQRIELGGEVDLPDLCLPGTHLGRLVRHHPLPPGAAGQTEASQVVGRHRLPRLRRQSDDREPTLEPGGQSGEPDGVAHAERGPLARGAARHRDEQRPGSGRDLEVAPGRCARPHHRVREPLGWDGAHAPWAAGASSTASAFLGLASTPASLRCSAVIGAGACVSGS